MRSPLKRKTNVYDALLMLKVFRDCIRTKVLPSWKSPCRKILSKIIREVRQ